MNKTTAGFGQKLLACFLALAMALSLLPATALAADGETQQNPPAPGNYEVYTSSNVLDISFWGNQSYVDVISGVTINGSACTQSTYTTPGENQYRVYDSDQKVTIGLAGLSTNSANTVVISANGYKNLTLSVTKSGNTWTGTVASTEKYVLMNIPYGEFYAAEKDGSDTAANVDAVSSATKKKTKKENLAAGSYHVNSDGSDITGITYPVHVADDSVLKNFTKVESKADLFGSASYAYCELTETPASYKELTVSGETKTFGKATGTVTKDEDATATLSFSDRHADYAIAVNNLDGVTLGATNVSGVTLHTTDKNVYGLRHVCEIWKGTELGFNVKDKNGNVTNYAALVNKTIDKITYYLNDGKILSFSTDLKILPKADATATVQSVDAGVTSTNFTVEGTFPEGFTPEYTVNLDGATVDEKNHTITLPKEAAFGAYALTITDESGKYAPITANFSLYGYVLMNIPYGQFYAAEKSKNDTVSNVDAVSSATKTKTKSTLAAGSYHVNENGTDITGITYPVRISDASVLKDLTQVTDSDSFSYTLTLRGKEVTTTYEGKDALFNKPSYSYYVLSEKPESYKVLSVRRGQKSFGAVTTTAQKLDAKVTLSTADKHADVMLEVEQAEDNAPIRADNVSGVTLHTTDNNVYGLRHVCEIWHGTELGFNIAGTNSRAALADKTIDKITYYLKDGSVYTISVNLYVNNLNTYTVDGTASSYREVGMPTFDTLSSKLDSDNKLFPNGRNDAYLVTIGSETRLIGGDTSLKRWEGTWEDWNPWTAADSTAMKARYPLIDDVWAQAAAAKGTTADALKSTWSRWTNSKGVASITVEGNRITWRKNDNTEVSDTYTMTGKVLKGLENATMYVFTADNLENTSDYKYFVTMAPGMEGEKETPIAAHYHFQYGKDLTQILNDGELHNAADQAMKDQMWYATMINANASDVAKYNVVLSMHKADKFSTENDVLSGVAGKNGTTYKPLFSCILNGKYDAYWRNYAAAVLGADNKNLDKTVDYLRNVCNGKEYGTEYAGKEISEAERQFYCGFQGDDATISVNGSTITVKKADGTELSTHDYIYQGTVTVGEGKMSFSGSLYMTTDENAGNYKYFLFREDTPDTTYHIEFRYGDSLEALKGYVTGKYAYWLAAGIPENADEAMIKNCIALFVLENMDYTAERTAKSKAQIADLVGTWDLYVNGSKQPLYFTVDSNGNGTTYYNGAVSSKYQVFAYDNDKDPATKSGIYAAYVAAEKEVSWADYTITTSGGKTVLTLTGYEGTRTYVKHTSSSGGGSSSSGSTTNAVSASAASNGKVSMDKTSAKRGDTVTITVTPNDGYKLDKLTVTDAKGNTIAATKKSDGTYTFTMPSSKVSVKADFVKADTASDSRFTDVPSNAYYAGAVDWAVKQGITSGTSAATFSPDVGCTRAQMVTFLWRAAGSPKATRSANPFTDVKADVYYYDAVLWAVEQGITSGTTASTFAPDTTCTRAHAVTFLWRAASSPAADAANAFTDVASGDYFASAVRWAAEKGVTSGTSATTFSPAATCTRAQIVTFLYRNAGN